MNDHGVVTRTIGPVTWLHTRRDYWPPGFWVRRADVGDTLGRGITGYTGRTRWRVTW